MKRVEQDSSFDWLIETYFSNPARWIHLKKGAILIRQGQYNNRLYLVRKGTLQGYMESPDGSRDETLRVAANSFLGVYSFFSKTYTSIATIEALSESEVAYITSQQVVIPTNKNDSLEKQFMPVVVADLMRRQQRMQELAEEKEQTLKKLLENQKLASLGQMAAGIAHEINNAVAVLARNTNWLVEQFSRHCTDPQLNPVFESGLMRGRFFSSREVRQRSRYLAKAFRLNDEEADLLAQTGITDDILKTYIEEYQRSISDIYDTWELGATIHDMMIASEQTTHVVKSMKALGTQHKTRQADLDINESIQNALSILRHRIKAVSLHLDLQPLPPVNGNMGEFVQVWMNLIKNACEAMAHEQPQPDNAELHLRSQMHNGHIFVTVKDNGPGIPQDILPNIFQPNVTTKISGLSFGLGLGLTIAQRIVSEYQGQIEVKSSKNGTTFIIQIPVGG